ncbi:MAG: PQQ-dependent sugar dehydrogenase [Patescibacteria group bacterium]|jgi:glucose/arabinose dehydrogenase
MDIKKFWPVLLSVLAFIVLAFIIFPNLNLPLPDSNFNSSPTPTPTSLVPQKIAANLNTPWSIVSLPHSGYLVTERPGNVKLVSSENVTQIGQVEEVTEIGEGGLLGAAIHPEFVSNNFVYFYHTYRNSIGDLRNRVVRYRFANNTLSSREVVFQDIPGANRHDGGRIKFGPDGFLYVTTGDALNPNASQDTSSLAGKILRLTDEGESAPGNPFGNPVYSYGHRNPQGLAWDGQNRLWATEHGSSGQDELNLIEPGNNYGWPLITGSQQSQGITPPVIQSGSDTWAPSGLAYQDGQLYFSGLRGQAVFNYNPLSSQLGNYFQQEFGRIRDIISDNSGNLIFATNNTDGRGRPQDNDDKIFLLATP